MPIHKDDGRRWVEVECLVPGTPEQVWEAIATGPGMTAWFTPTTVDEREGGAIEFDFGGGALQRAEVTGWQPPHRFTYEEAEWSSTGDAPGPLATEVTVTSHSGDQCVVRMVHSLFTDADDWNDEIESFEGGWPGFFEVLRLYLRDFGGQPVTPIRVMASYAGDAERGWTLLSTALGLSGADVAARVESPSGAPELGGVVERVGDAGGARDTTLRIDRPGPGVAVVGICPMGDTASAMVSLYLYGADAAAIGTADRAVWDEWLRAVLDGDAVAT